MSKKGISTVAVIGAVLVGLFSFVVFYNGLHPKLAIATVAHMLSIGSVHIRVHHSNYLRFMIISRLGAHGFFGLALLGQSPLSSHPPSDYVEIGYINNLKLKVRNSNYYFL